MVQITKWHTQSQLSIFLAISKSRSSIDCHHTCKRYHAQALCSQATKQRSSLEPYAQLAGRYRPLQLRRTALAALSNVGVLPLATFFPLSSIDIEGVFVH